MNLSHICFIVPGYPTDSEPIYTFVKQLVCSIADLGIKCSVIAPQSITKICVKQRIRRPTFWQDTSERKNKIDVYQPTFVSFSNIKFLGTSISRMLSEYSIMKTFKRIRNKPDVIYAHFWHSGVIAGIIGQKYNLPVFVATGESKIWVKNLYRDKKLYKSLKDIKGVICVSTKNMEESINLKLATQDKMTVIPNAINNKLFYPMDKTEVRKKLGYKQEDFIVAYTGAFSHRKGVLRLSEAVKTISGVKSIYIGSGDLKPTEEGILFMGRLPHDQVAYYLNAADVFVLPTLAEGCCNAIIEAMACGLPIVSSNQRFNDDILDDSNSIRIDVNDVEAIRQAIILLRDNSELRKKMSEASLAKALSFTIDNRAKNIIKFMESKI